MKIQSLLASIVLSFTGLSALQALDLTPTFTFRLLEDIKIPVLHFQDGPRKVQWQPPGSWAISGGGQSLTLRPPDSSNMAMELRLIPHNAAQAPDGTTALDAVLAWVQPFLPGDAGKVAFEREMPSPFMLGGKSSREMTFTYTSLAQNFTTSVAVVDLDSDHSIAVVIYARSKDFAAIHAEGTKSMFRWLLLDSASQHAQSAGRGSGTASSDYRPGK